MTDEVEGVEVFADFLGERVQGQAFCFELFEDSLLALGGIPTGKELM